MFKKAQQIAVDRGGLMPGTSRSSRLRSMNALTGKGQGGVTGGGGTEKKRREVNRRHNCGHYREKQDYLLQAKGQKRGNLLNVQ